jgi:potassium efflux system protein
MPSDCLLLAGCLLLLALVSGAAHSQGVASFKTLTHHEDSAPIEPTTATNETDPAAAIHKHLAQAEVELAALDESSDNNGQVPAEIGQKQLDQRRALLNQLITAYRLQLNRLNAVADFEAYRDAARQNHYGISALSEADSSSFLAVDQLRENERLAVRELATQNVALTLVQRQYEQKAEEVKKANALKRQATERLESNRSPEQLARLRWNRDMATLRARVEGAWLEHLELEIRSTKLRQQSELERLEEIRSQLARGHGKLVFTQGELNQLKDHLEDSRRELASELEAATNASEDAHAQLQQAEKELAASAEVTSTDARAAASGVSAPGQDREMQRRALELKRVEVENLTQRTRLLSLQSEALAREAEIWDQRWALNQHPDAPTLSKEAADFEQERSKLKLLHEYITQRYASARDKGIEQEGLVKRAASPEASQHHTRLLELYRQRRDLYEEALQRLAGYESLVDRWGHDLELTGQRRPISQRLEQRLDALWSGLVGLWQYEVFAADDQIEVDGQVITGKRSVTVGKFLSALLILVLGYKLSRWLSHAVERIVVKRTGMDPSHATLTRRWVDALGLVVLGVIALTLVKIPLTVFAFLGGAVAIGVGFGTQTLLKNLISGLMILFERPVNLGDLVDVGGIRGRVVDVGVRASIVRDMHGIETLIPNSSFLEENVTNWTYSSQRVRFSVQVGIAYGSDTRRVRDILLEAGARHGLVLKDPPPFVTFDDFGADALLFSLNFWVELKPENDRLIIQSDLRFMLDEALSKAGISIAFPQRDLHLDTTRPLEVQVVNGHATQSTPSAGENR